MSPSDDPLNSGLNTTVQVPVQYIPVQVPVLVTMKKTNQEIGPINNRIPINKYFEPAVFEKINFKMHKGIVIRETFGLVLNEM